MKPKNQPGDALVRQLVTGLDEAYDRKSWHGTNLRGSLRGMTAASALWRPGAGRHNIWELMLHAAYWKYVVRRRISGAKRGSFVLPGSNFFARADGDQQRFQAELAILEEEHCALRELIVSLDPTLLTRAAPGGRMTHESVIRGVAAHDLYHAGQIQLIKRLAP